MLNKPKLKDCFASAVVPPETVFLLTEDRHWVLTGRVYPHVLPLLTGQNTTSELLALLADQVSAPEVLYTLKVMEAKGYLTEGDQATSVPEAAFWQTLGRNAADVQSQLRTTGVTVEALGDIDTAPLTSALAQFGIDAHSGDGLRVVVTDNYLQPDLAQINNEAIADKRPWLLVRLVGTSCWIGPLFVPEATACWACLAERIAGNRQLESYLLRKTEGTGPLPLVLGATPTTIAIGAHLAATEIAKWLVLGKNQQLTDQIVTLNLLDLSQGMHHVVRRPQCPACGDPGYGRSSRPLQLVSRPKRHTSDGGHRTALPEETYARFQHHISPISGVISWLGPLGDEANGLTYSYAAGHNFAMMQDDLYWLRNNLRSNTGGKGASAIQAKVSAMGEAIERYSGVFRGDEPVVRASYRELGNQAVHINTCLQFSQAQYAQRDAWNSRRDSGRFHVVPRPFDETTVLDWVSLWSLSGEERRYLPAAYCYFGHPDTNAFFYCVSDGNGTAAGNTQEEAILQGFLELVERDSASIWWYNRLQRPAVDLASFDLPYLRAIQQHYAQQGRELWVLDLTADLGIPTFVAVSRRTDHPVQDIILGLGSHLDPQVGLLRAVTELNQFLPAVARRTATGDAIYNFPEGEAVAWWKAATIEEMPYLLPHPAASPRRASDYRNLSSADLLQDVQTCVAIAGEAGLEVLVLDQTRPDIGMPVCRVVVPGLRHFWRRLGPGRLFDVPVQLGWLSSPHAEDALNPWSIFF